MDPTASAPPLSPRAYDNADIDMDERFTGIPSVPPLQYEHSNADQWTVPKLGDQETEPQAGKVQKTRNTQFSGARDEGLTDRIGICETCAASPHLKSWFLTALALSSFVWFLDSILNFSQMYRNEFEIPLAVFFTVYTIMIIETFFSSSYGYLSEIGAKSRKTILKRLKNARPYIIWRIQCYHYITVYDTTYQNGNMITTPRSVRVDTHKGSCKFKFTSWTDETRHKFSSEANVTKLYLTKIMRFDNATSYANYKKQKVKFTKKNVNDSYHDFEEDLHIPGFERILCTKQQSNFLPCYLNRCCFIICHLIFLGPCFRWVFSSLGRKEEVKIVKKFSTQ